MRNLRINLDLKKKKRGEENTEKLLPDMLQIHGYHLTLRLALGF